MKKISHLSVWGAVLFWSLSYVWSKGALLSFSYLFVVLMRYSLASLIFLALFLIKGFPRFSPGDFIRVVLSSFFFPFLYFTVETFALTKTTASEAGIISAMLPVMVILLSWIFLRQRPSGKILFCMALSFLGVYILSTGGGAGFSRENWLGNLLMVFAMLCAALYMLVLSGLKEAHTSLEVTGTQIILGTVFILIFSWIKRGELDITGPLVQGGVMVVLLALFSTVVAFFCYNHALSQMEPSRVALYINSMPLFTALFAFLFLGERLSGIQWFGGGAIILGMTVLVLPERKKVLSNISG